VRHLRTAAIAFALAAGIAQPAAQTGGYVVAVASEAADKLTFVRFSGGAARVESEIDTGIMPTSVDGPHGLAVSPDGKFFYVSLAHGQPNGTVLKYSTATRAVVGRVVLGLFPATLQTSPGGDFLYVVNFNLHGDPVPSSVSIVLADRMAEIARVPTCRMPHGSRVSPDGARHYSACMMDDALVEIDTARLAVSRHFIVTRGREAGGPGAPMAAGAAGAASTHAGHGTEAPPAGSTICSPTWAQPSANGASVFVACNGTSELVEVDTETWTLRRRIPARPGIYNLAITKSGRLVATNKRDQSVSIIELETGKELARLPTRRRVVHGVVVSPDDRYAFVTVEGIAAEPGTVEIIDLVALKTVTTVDVPPQAGGIDIISRGDFVPADRPLRAHSR
jgi:DNA-binding beta-propeller fold protein YncE